MNSEMNSIYYKKIDGRYRCFIKLDNIFISQVTETVIVEGTNTKHEVKCSFFIKDEIELINFKCETKQHERKLIVSGKELDLSDVKLHVNAGNKNTLMSITVYFETDLVEFE